MVAVLAGALVALAGCTKPGPAATEGAGAAGTKPGAVTAEAGGKPKTAFHAEFVTAPQAVKAGSPADFIFTVKDAGGNTVRDLSVVHERPMHLLVVSDDLAEFNHLHPEPQADGSYKVTFTFKDGGAYKLYADFTPPGAAQVVDRHDLTVSGGVRERVPLVADASPTKTVESLRVTMKPDKPLRAGQETMLDFTVADATSGRPVTDLQPYLGAMAHFVIISEDTTDFLHAHPMEKGGQMAMASGGDHEATPHSHGAGDVAGVKKPTGASVSEVAAHTTFPRAGLYKVWAQFQRGGQVITVPYVVRVAAGENAVAGASDNPSGSDQPVPADAIKIIVSASSYEPSRISVKKGQPVRLAFYRADAQNCGGKVVFPSLNIERELPAGRTTVVEITPERSGELAFTCGMKMLRGALVVE